jgi:hypothetical protein
VLVRAQMRSLVVPLLAQQCVVAPTGEQNVFAIELHAL